MEPFDPTSFFMKRAAPESEWIIAPASSGVRIRPPSSLGIEPYVISERCANGWEEGETITDWSGTK